MKWCIATVIPAIDISIQSEQKLDDLKVTKKGNTFEKPILQSAVVKIYTCTEGKNFIEKRPTVESFEDAM